MGICLVNSYPAIVLDIHQLFCIECGAMVEVVVKNCGCQDVVLSDDDDIDITTGHRHECKRKFPNFLQFARDLRKNPTRNGQSNPDLAKEEMSYVIASNLISCQECGGAIILQIFTCGCTEPVFPCKNKPSRLVFTSYGHHPSCRSRKPAFLDFKHFSDSH
ncbi:hypothetical protein KKA15_00045 [Patescibacteria group bacterium]|nr:hypothetical protein [Patescibacteria group bacterium]